MAKNFFLFRVFITAVLLSCFLLSDFLAIDSHPSHRFESSSTSQSSFHLSDNSRPRQGDQGLDSRKNSLEKSDYILGGGDVLKIQVYDEPDLSIDEIRVSIDGYINFPLLGKILVRGLDTSQLESKIEELLMDGYILNPQVSILVEEYASRKVFILGAVRRPGSYELKTQTTILEMIAQAGGVTQEGAQRFMILRSIGNESKTIVIDRKKLIDEGDLSLNETIYNHDTIYVPLGDVIYVYGEVTKPGPYQMTKQNRTVLSAITQAGGFTKIGSPRRTRVVRVIDGEARTINVNVDDIIKKGDKDKDIELIAEDVIIVPETIF